jgi:hypothetical protein
MAFSATTFYIRVIFDIYGANPTDTFVPGAGPYFILSVPSLWFYYKGAGVPFLAHLLRKKKLTN